MIKGWLATTRALQAALAMVVLAACGSNTSTASVPPSSSASSPSATAASSPSATSNASPTPNDPRLVIWDVGKDVRLARLDAGEVDALILAR